MGDSVRNLVALFIIASALSACAGTGGDALLRSGDYSGAIAAYEAAEQATPDDGQVKRNLGVAYLRSGEHARALSKLEEARALRPDDPRVYFFLAEAHEEVGDFEGALLSYRDYLASGGKNEISLQMRVRELARKRAAREIALALQSEESRAVPSDSMTLAVPDFTNISGSRELAPLAKGLSAVVITDLRKVEAFRVVERERWHVLRSELELAHQEPAVVDTSGAESGSEWAVADSAALSGQIGQTGTDSAGQEPESESDDLEPAFEENESGLIDPSVAPVLGRVLGAGTLVQGLFTVISDTEIQLDAAIVDIETTETTIAGDPVAGNLIDVLHLEKQLVYQILQGLGVTPTEQERAEIDSLIVSDYRNFFEYCRALALEDQEHLDESSALFREVLVREPEFARRMDVASRINEPRQDFAALEQEELAGLAAPPPESTEGGPFLDDLVVSVGNGPGPDGGDGADQDDDDATDVTITDIEKVEQDLESIPDFPPPPGGRR